MSQTRTKKVETRPSPDSLICMTTLVDSTPLRLAEFAATLATTVGHLIRDRREGGVTVADTKSSAVDVVTEADREAERVVVDAILKARPDDGIVGEEGTGIDGTSGITWVIDPIDGTTNYLYDHPIYAVSIAATVPDASAFADGRRAIVGAVYCPRLDELFEAYEGGGARLNGTPIHVSEQRDLSQTLLGTGFGYTVERRREDAGFMANVLPRVRDIRRLGSAAYDLCSVAVGRIDAFFEKGLQPWDYAAAALIAKEAGAIAIGRDDETPPGTPLLFLSNPNLVHELRSVVLGE